MSEHQACSKQLVWVAHQRGRCGSVALYRQRHRRFRHSNCTCSTPFASSNIGRMHAFTGWSKGARGPGERTAYEGHARMPGSLSGARCPLPGLPSPLTVALSGMHSLRSVAPQYQEAPRHRSRTSSSCVLRASCSGTQLRAAAAPEGGGPRTACTGTSAMLRLASAHVKLTMLGGVKVLMRLVACSMSLRHSPCTQRQAHTQGMCMSLPSPTLQLCQILNDTCA